MCNHIRANFFSDKTVSKCTYLLGSQWQKLFKGCFFLSLELLFLPILDNNNVAFPIFVLEFLCQLTGILTRINDLFLLSLMLTWGEQNWANFWFRTVFKKEFNFKPQPRTILVSLICSCLYYEMNDLLLLVPPVLTAC